jgi:general secretion pathway protein D
LKLLAQLLLVTAVVVLGGCAAQATFREGTALIEAGRTEEGLAKIEEASKLDPSKHEYRAYLLRQREIALQRSMAEGDALRLQSQWDAAEAAYRKAAGLDPAHPRPKLAIELLQRERRHQALLAKSEAALKAGNLQGAYSLARAVLSENPQHREALALLRRIEEKTVSVSGEPRLSADLQRPITLEFRDTNLRAVFELISRNTGINFFFDKDLRPDLRTTVFVRNTSIEDVIRFILVTNQLERKVLSHNSLLIYPNTPAKIREYQELVTKSFYLAHADVKQTANMIRSLIKTKDMFMDEKLKLLVMRDTPDAIRMAEKLVATQDLAHSEVMLEVEVMEVGSSLLTELGIRYLDQLSYSIVGAEGVPGTITLPEWLNRSSALYRITVTDPFATLNLKDQFGKASILANPRIRVKDAQKAKIHIGDKVPVITTTLSAQGFASESVSYLDVGLKLEVEPDISLSNEVAIKVGLEVSNIVQEVKSPSGTLTYRVGTRNASTVLHLRDGETQILAGLITDEDRKVADRVPGLGSLPVIGRLFSSHKDTTNKTEVVLLITPRILRLVSRPDVRITEFLSGTEAVVGAPPLTLRSVEPASTPPLPPQPGVTPKPAVGAVNPGAAIFALKAPAHARVGEQFMMSVEVTAEKAFRAGTFDLAFDQSRLKVVKVEEGALLRKAGKDASFRYSIQDAAGRLNVSYAVGGELKGSGGFVMLTFEVTGPQHGTTVIRMEAPSALDPAGKSLAVASPAPFSMLLSR